ncbi:MAG: ubiquinol-cytochrome C chaperone family protein [Alphaproteobacteria bacterium]|nr:ubiquinol-cytochrome C chaperone family protein [Alphaproteobacteria bacterium]
MFNIFKLLRRDPYLDPAHRLYVALVGQARQPGFYAGLGVPDSLDGRFEMISLHAFLVLRRLRAAGEPGRRLGQALFDVMFADMDQNLREMGVGDLGVGKRVKAMASGLYGRIAAYEGALAGPDDEAQAALRRNVFGTAEPPADALPALALYLRREAEALAGQPDVAIMAGDVRFGAPPEAGAAPAQGR